MELQKADAAINWVSEHGQVWTITLEDALAARLHPTVEGARDLCDDAAEGK